MTQLPFIKQMMHNEEVVSDLVRRQRNDTAWEGDVFERIEALKRISKKDKDEIIVRIIRQINIDNVHLQIAIDALKDTNKILKEAHEQRLMRQERPVCKDLIKPLWAMEA
jgi:hypothetical protein